MFAADADLRLFPSVLCGPSNVIYGNDPAIESVNFAGNVREFKPQRRTTPGRKMCWGHQFDVPWSSAT